MTTTDYTATTLLGYGLNATTATTLVNLNTGASHYGAVDMDAFGTVENYGAIRGAQVAYAAVSIETGGTVINGGTHSVIYRANDGAAIHGTRTTVVGAVTNACTITTGMMVRSRSRQMHIRHRAFQEPGRT